MKICIIGYSGSGKSTLADLLGEKYALPVLHMDATFWYGNWQYRSREEQSDIVRKFMSENSDGWIIEGNYAKICLDRFTECDKVYFLNYNRFVCFKQAVKRFKENKGTVRPDCLCPEKLDAEFIFWLLFAGRTRKRRKIVKNLFEKASGKKYVFKNRRQLIKHLSSL